MIDIEEIGELADKADNHVAASKLPMPAAIHVGCLVGGLEEIRDKLREYYVQQTGENPWEDSDNG